MKTIIKIAMFLIVVSQGFAAVGDREFVGSLDLGGRLTAVGFSIEGDTDGGTNLNRITQLGTGRNMFITRATVGARPMVSIANTAGGTGPQAMLRIRQAEDGEKAFGIGDLADHNSFNFWIHGDGDIWTKGLFEADGLATMRGGALVVGDLEVTGNIIANNFTAGASLLLSGTSENELKVASNYDITHQDGAAATNFQIRLSGKPTGDYGDYRVEIDGMDNADVWTGLGVLAPRVFELFQVTISSDTISAEGDTRTILFNGDTITLTNTGDDNEGDSFTLDSAGTYDGESTEYDCTPTPDEAATYLEGNAVITTDEYTNTFKWSDDDGSSWIEEDVTTQSGFYELQSGIKFALNDVEGTADLAVGSNWEFTVSEEATGVFNVDTSAGIVTVGKALVVVGDHTSVDGNITLTNGAITLTNGTLTAANIATAGTIIQNGGSRFTTTFDGDYGHLAIDMRDNNQSDWDTIFEVINHLDTPTVDVTGGVNISGALTVERGVFFVGATPESARVVLEQTAANGSPRIIFLRSEPATDINFTIGVDPADEKFKISVGDVLPPAPALAVDGNADVEVVNNLGVGGHVGIVTASSATIALNIAETRTAESTSIQIFDDVTPAAAIGIADALRFTINLGGSSADNVASLIGVSGNVFTNRLGVVGYSGTLTNAACISANMVLRGNFAGGDPTITNAYLFRGVALTKALGSVITNAYGLYLPDISAGGTLNHSIFSPGGTMVHAGGIRIGDTTAPGDMLEVAGVSQFGDGGTTDFSEVEADGTLEFNGAATVWDDLRVPVLSTKVGAATFQPTWAQLADDGAGSRGVYTYYFAPNIDNEVFFVAQMSHRYKEGTDLEAHVHWTPDNADTGQVTWKLEYVLANIAGNFGTTATITIPDVGSGTAGDHQVTACVAIDGTGLTISHMLVCRLYRDVSDGDDFTGNAGLLEVDFHYEIDTVGSRTEFTK